MFLEMQVTTILFRDGVCELHKTLLCPIDHLQSRTRTNHTHNYSLLARSKMLVASVHLAKVSTSLGENTKLLTYVSIFFPASIFLYRKSCHSANSLKLMTHQHRAVSMGYYAPPGPGRLYISHGADCCCYLYSCKQSQAHDQSS